MLKLVRALTAVVAARCCNPPHTQAHAAVVSKFVANGFDEHMKKHEVPAVPAGTLPRPLL